MAKEKRTSSTPIHPGLKSFDILPDSAQVRVPVVAGLNGISTVTVWRWSRDGRLPKPSRRGGVTTWNVGELRRTLAAVRT